ESVANVWLVDDAVVDRSPHLWPGQHLCTLEKARAECVDRDPASGLHVEAEGVPAPWSGAPRIHVRGLDHGRPHVVPLRDERAARQEEPAPGVRDRRNQALKPRNAAADI